MNKSFEKSLHALNDAKGKIEKKIAELTENPETDISIICIVANETTAETGVTIYGSMTDITSSLAGAYRDEPAKGILNFRVAIAMLEA